MTARPSGRTAAWLDAIAIVLLLISFRIALEGGLSFEVFGERVTAREGWRPFFVAVLLLGLRHMRWPRPWIGARIANALRTWDAEPYGTIALLFVTSRLGVLLVGLLAVLAIGLRPGAKPQVSENPLRDLPARWDATWYVGIGRDGYSYDARRGADEEQSIAFFPAFPLLIRLAGVLTEPEREVDMTYERYVELLNGRLGWGATLIALACFLAALVVFFRWAEARAGPAAAGSAAMLLTAYPFAVFFSAGYTESLFLLGTISAFYAFEGRRWMAASAWGLIVGLTRPNGAMLSLALAVLALAPALAREPGWRRQTVTGLAVAAAPGIGLLTYASYIWSLTGDPFAWMHVQRAWGRTAERTASYFDWMYRVIRDQGFLVFLADAPIEFLQALAVLFSLGMIWPVWRRLGPAYAIFIAANLLPPLFRGGVISIGRLTSTMFPQFLALALLTPESRRGPLVLGFALLQGLLAALFFTWREVF